MAFEKPWIIQESEGRAMVIEDCPEVREAMEALRETVEAIRGPKPHRHAPVTSSYWDGVLSYEMECRDNIDSGCPHFECGDQ